MAKAKKRSSKAKGGRKAAKKGGRKGAKRKGAGRKKK